MSAVGNHLSRAEIARRRADARQWRIDNKPYFDAIYEPEELGGRCLACDGKGLVLETAEAAHG